MSYALLIVESPAKCNKIEKLLGSGYKCVASFGHIRELKGLASIDIANNFTPKYTNMPSKSKQISTIRQMIGNASEVIIASDDDREGEAIGWHICETFRLPISSTKRIVFHEITGTALKRAINNARTLDMNIIYAQQARQILDVLVGFKISPILWDKISYHTSSSLSAGRCQTPALRLVYDNQKELDNNPGRKVYKTTGNFTKLNIPFTLNYNHSSEESISTFLEETVNYEHIFNCSQPKQIIKQPPQPFTTSTLQQAASNELKFSPKKTMDMCQKLYESGLITYMRTDSKTYSSEFLDNSRKKVDEKYGNDYVRDDIESLSERSSDKNKSTENAQEAHEAIRPTDISIENALSGPEARLYKLIWRNTLESCMSPAKFESITAKLTAPEERFYTYSVERVLFMGWKAVAGISDPEPKEYGFLRTLKSGTIIDYNKITASVTLKDVGSHFTEARLVQLLEKRGIGRPSTFSSLIDKIQEREYVKKTDISGISIQCTDFELEGEEISETIDVRTFGNERNKLQIQPLGIIVIELLIKHFDKIFAYDYTKNMENHLDHIASGEMNKNIPLSLCLDEIEKESKKILSDRVSIPIDSNHTYIIAKYGPVIKYTNESKTEFKKVIDNVDLDRLRRGEYKLADLLRTNNKERNLGKYKKHDVILKNGKYGNYIEWNKEKKSITVNKSFNDIVLSDISEILESKKSSNIIRTIDAHTSIRNSEYGDYVFHKSPNAKKPVFIKLASFIKENGVDSYKTCSLETLTSWLSKEKQYIK